MPRTASIGIRVEPELKFQVEELAKTDGRSLARWIERLLIREVQAAAPHVLAEPRRSVDSARDRASDSP